MTGCGRYVTGLRLNRTWIGEVSGKMTTATRIIPPPVGSATKSPPAWVSHTIILYRSEKHAPVYQRLPRAKQNMKVLNHTRLKLAKVVHQVGDRQAMTEWR
jgi:hypothetical protein